MNKKHHLFQLLSIFCIGILFCLFTGAKSVEKKTTASASTPVLNGLDLRNIGPANMGGRIDDFAVVESDPHTIYVGTASGGVWKTTNNGVSWEPIFDDQVTSTIGDVTVAPSNPDIVWVGTGEANNRQSSSWGNGVYKSPDGGKTWKNMGLKATHHIGRIVIHPLNPDIVYVAAVGHLWGPNKERGLYKTEDGGKTWVNTKFINEDTGFIDVALDPGSPDTLYAAAYQRRRRGWGFSGGGPHSGLYKTTDGGENWTKLYNGLPSGDTGRIGIDIYRKDSSIVYVTYENKKGGVFRSEDKGFTWKKMSPTNPRPMYYSKIRIDPNNDQRIWVLGASIYFSDDGGKKFSTDLVRSPHGDYHAMWINPQDSDHIILGSDGGIYFSYDRGQNWDFVNTIPLAQFYEIGYDMQDPYWVYGGLQDNGSWGGPSASLNRLGVTNDSWIKIGGGDGFYTQVDPTDPTKIYAESQTGNLFRIDRVTGERVSLSPRPKDDKEEYRFNWNCPILISPHDPNTVFYGGNKLFISKDRGANWESSQDLTSKIDREEMPLMGKNPDKSTLSRHDGIAYFGDITTVTESPLKKGLIYVGTDDGNLQISQDGGKIWVNLNKNVPGMKQYTYVTRVVASRYSEGRAYATLDGHRNNDFTAYVYVTENYGKTWKDISANMPAGSIVNVIREHHRNSELLFIGTERGAYFSLNRGGKWIRIGGNFPMVPVDDIAVHPRENDLILGTHGRSIWIMDDITYLEKYTEGESSPSGYIFPPLPATMFNAFSHKGNLGDKIYVAPNPPSGAMISYYLKEKQKGKVSLVISNASGDKVRELKGPGSAGINRVIWDMRYEPPETADEGRRSYYRARGPFVLPGEYQLVMKLGENELTETVKVEGDGRVDISFKDRKAQHDVLFKIYKIYGPLNASNKALTSLQKEINAIKKNLKKVKDVPEAVDKKIESISKRLKDISLELLGDPSAGWRGMRSAVRGRLMMLFGSIGGYTGAPSESQVNDVDKQIEAFESLVGQVNAVIETDFPELNKLLNENNIPRLFAGEKIKLK